MMAAAVAGRDVCYFTFDDADLRDDLHEMHSFICDKNLSVSKCLCVINAKSSATIFLRNGTVNHHHPTDCIQKKNRQLTMDYLFEIKACSSWKGLGPSLSVACQLKPTEICCLQVIFGH